MDYLLKLETAWRGQELNPDIWEEDTLSSEISDKLTEIAHDFADKYEIPPKAIDDILLVGSMANFNWDDKSDIDVHLVVDFGKLEGEQKLLRSFFDIAKDDWKDDHDIDLCGHPVEMYVQGTQDKIHSNGVYSLRDGQWRNKPEDDIKKSSPAAEKKAATFDKQISQLANKAKSNPDTAFQEADKLKDTLSGLRKSGLASGGEGAMGNLVYKSLRRSGGLKRLADVKHGAYDDMMSLDTCKTEGTIREFGPESTISAANAAHPASNSPASNAPTNLAQQSGSSANLGRLLDFQDEQTNREFDGKTPEEKMALLHRQSTVSYQLASKALVAIERLQQTVRDLERQVEQQSPALGVDENEDENEDNYHYHPNRKLTYED